MALYKRGDVYWFKFKFDGVTIRKSTKTSNQRAAREIEAAYRVKLAKGEAGIDVEEPPPVPTFDAAMHEYLDRSRVDNAGKRNTVRRAETSSKALLRYFGNRKLDMITVDDIERFKDWRRVQRKQAPHKKLKKNARATTTKVIKPASVNRELACLRAMMNFYIRKDVLAKNPVSRVKFLKEDNELMRVVTEDEERRYLMAASQPLRDVATLMIETGARPEEVCRLEHRHVRRRP